MLMPRRSVLAGAALLGCGERASAGAAILYVAPDGAGSGGSWEDAAPLQDLPGLIDATEGDGEILVAADRGVYAIDEPIAIGRRRGRGKVRIRGVNADGAPGQALVRGTRADGEIGNEAFRLLNGAAGLHFSHFDFQAIGNGCFRVAGRVNDLIIEDCGFEDIYRFLENTGRDESPDASLRRFAVRRCLGARVERGFARVRYQSRDGLFEDCHAQGLPNEAEPLPIGCVLEDRAGDITYRRCVMEGFQQWRAADYWNGDGFCDEWETFGVRYIECVARGSTDAGFDCKSPDVVLENCTAEDNKRNFRIWNARARLTGCTSRRPNFRGRDQEYATANHIWMSGEVRAVQIDDLTVEDTDATPILTFDGEGGRVEIRGVSIDSPQRNWGAEVSDRSGVIVATS